MKGLVDFVAELQECGAQFRSLTDGIDTTTPAGHFFFHVMAPLSRWSGGCWPNARGPASTLCRVEAGSAAGSGG